MRRALAGLAAVLALVGCGSGAPASPSASPKPAHSATVAPGPEHFLATVRKAGLGGKDVAGTPDKVLLNIGRVLCDGFDNGQGYQDAISAVISTTATKPTTHQAIVWVDTAVRDLCPAHESEIPAGAP
jgi:Protein of unknown function (DUF732)